MEFENPLRKYIEKTGNEHKHFGSNRFINPLIYACFISYSVTTKQMYTQHYFEIRVNREKKYQKHPNGKCNALPNFKLWFASILYFVSRG